MKEKNFDLQLMIINFMTTENINLHYYINDNISYCVDISN